MTESLCDSRIIYGLPPGIHPSLSAGQGGRSRSGACIAAHGKTASRLAWFANLRTLLEVRPRSTVGMHAKPPVLLSACTCYTPQALLTLRNVRYVLTPPRTVSSSSSSERGIHLCELILSRAHKADSFAMALLT